MVAVGNPFDTSQLAPELTTKEAAEALGVHPKTVRRYLADGSLIARNAAPLGSRRPSWRIPAEAVLSLRSAYAPQGFTKPARASDRRVAPYVPKIFTSLKN